MNKRRGGRTKKRGKKRGTTRKGKGGAYPQTLGRFPKNWLGLRGRGGQYWDPGCPSSAAVAGVEHEEGPGDPEGRILDPRGGREQSRRCFACFVRGLPVNAGGNSTT